MQVKTSAHHCLRISLLPTFIFTTLLPLVLLTACVGPMHEQVLFERAGTRIGLQTDLSTQRSSPPTTNAHPRQISPQDMRILLGSIEVSGWSGILLGLFQERHPFPVFTVDELDIIAGPIAQAFEQAVATERVFFSIPGKEKPYPSEKERIEGALFFRNQYLHVVLTNHYAFSSADPGGGEERDPRDTKGMKLWVASPAMAAIVPMEQEPVWTAFEKVHISLNPTDVLIARESKPVTTPISKTVASTTPTTAPSQPKMAETDQRKTTESTSDQLHLQVNELTNANLDLRSRLKEQSAEIQTLREELEQLRKQIKPRSPTKPSTKSSPSSSTP